MSDYTPTEARICIDFCNAATKRAQPDGSFISMEEADAAFSRWLAAHDAEVRAQADAEIRTFREQYIPRLTAAEAELAEVRAGVVAEEPKWEYAQSEVLTDGTVAFGNPVETLEEAIRRRDIDRINYPWPEEIGVGRRRKAGLWVPLEN